MRFFRGDAEERAEFADMTEIFDRVWYGLLPVIDGSDLAAIRTRVAALLERKTYA